MEKIIDGIANKIKPKLKEKKMTGEQFSIKMGKGENWLTQLGNSQKDMMVTDLVKACEILNVWPCYLLSFNPTTHICNFNLEDCMKIFIKNVMFENNATHKENK